MSGFLAVLEEAELSGWGTFCDNLNCSDENSVGGKSLAALIIRITLITLMSFVTTRTQIILSLMTTITLKPLMIQTNLNK